MEGATKTRRYRSDQVVVTETVSPGCGIVPRCPGRSRALRGPLLLPAYLSGHGSMINGNAHSLRAGLLGPAAGFEECEDTETLCVQTETVCVQTAVSARPAVARRCFRGGSSGSAAAGSSAASWSLAGPTI